MGSEEKIDKILELQVKQSTDIALIKQAQDIHLDDYKKVRGSHYNLKEEFNAIKSKVVVISSAVVVVITAVFNYIWRYLTKEN